MRLFDTLYKRREEAEAAIDETLKWRRLEGKKSSTIDLTRDGDLMDNATRKGIFERMRTNTERFITTFKPKVQPLL